ncbi:prolyl oligopeptidase family serine peptidase [Autumnicola musiva]|uniref:prolyl oligopeptidase n=1 Tax=Autumnicola musiva TaxID=3075589 RepID=A0ABU3D8E1_9FLAO|nr:prolyl oligopeptidase family serine peptidase [Zunongwangia sp. F117]MDT0677788.1 prolyl oligopeptidase family serine peptidase [Zunongwangia sp. F117]
MKKRNYFMFLWWSLVSAISAFGQVEHVPFQYPQLSKQVKTQTKFSVELKDDYSNLENLEDKEVVDWLKAQDSLAEAYFANNDLMEHYLEKFSDYQKLQNGTISMIEVNEAGNYFYLKYEDSSSINKLFFREYLSAEEVELFDPKNYKDEISEITYLKPSFNGEKVAIGYKNDENFGSSVIFLDVKNKKLYSDLITNINPAFGGIEWLPDSSGFIYLYFPVVDQNKPGYKKNSFSVLYKLGDSQEVKKNIFGNSNTVNIPADFYPKVNIGSSQDKYVVGYSASSSDYYDAYIAKISDLISGKANWIPFFTQEQKVFYNQGEVRGEEFIFRQGNEKGNHVASFKINNPDFDNPEILAKGTKDNPITQFEVAKDKIYFACSKYGVEVSLWEINNKKKKKQLNTPFSSGYVTFFGGSVNKKLIGVELDGWTSDYTRFIITKDGDFRKEGLQQEMLYPEFDDLVSEQTMVSSYDGVEVPLSLVYKKGIELNSENEVFVYVYGAYGESMSPFFSPIFLDWAARGGILAFPHVRGGGEKGKDWHKQGMKTLKYNSWKDLIACTEALIEKGYTQKGLVSLYTASAGGITAGMAVNERPDLFSSFIAEVPRLNPLDLESSATVSSTSYLEYGTVDDNTEFIGLVKMDPYYNLKETLYYPATLIMPASQDDRIPLWDSGKYIAKLQSISTGNKPVLMDIDYEFDHDGLGNYDETVRLYSKIFSFARSNMKNESD